MSYRRFPVMTLIEALGQLSMSKMHTKSQISQFERSHTVQHNFYTNLDKNIFRIMHRECVYKLWVSINRPDLSYRYFPVVTLIEALGHFPISKIHTKSQVLKDSIKCSTIFTQIWIKIFLELMHRECVYKL